MGSGGYFGSGGRRYTDADAHCYSHGDRHANSEPHCNSIGNGYAETDANTQIRAIAKAAPHASSQILDFVLPKISQIGPPVKQWAVVGDRRQAAPFPTE